jgi:ATP-dependent DNA helicase RecQ
MVDITAWNTLHLTEAALPLLRGQETFSIRKRVRLAKPTKGKKGARGEGKGGRPSIVVDEKDAPLFAALRVLRAEIAAEAGVPPYVVCHDRTLADVVALKPRTIDQLKLVHGMGEAKIAKYGTQLLEVVGRFHAA